MNDTQIALLAKQRHAELVAQAELSRLAPHHPGRLRKLSAKALHRVADVIDPAPEPRRQARVA
jgi:hypothetical protein